jgi:hypothetical protein
MADVQEPQQRQAREIHRIASLARAIANVVERIHVLNRVGVSQLIVAAKKPI